MIFLQGLFNIMKQSYGESINHFPLIELIFYSIDQTLFYFIIWLIFRVIYLTFLKKGKKRKSLYREISLNAFIFYIILLIHLTIFREEHSIGNVRFNMQPLSAINLTPLTHTLKLTKGVTLFDYYYNFYGNILWFVPMGFVVAYLLNKKPYFLKTLLTGFCFSFFIEMMQFFLGTGITDIDDLLFNTIGTIVGLICFMIVEKVVEYDKKKRKSN
ncbi:VanZ family protein [Carnobacterium sp. TMP28]|uniref:VanZ family protein n=1 Tax=Carnobacterium sp. TMP28 TaxID=3397060 RepID=UPI0039E01CDD